MLYWFLQKSFFTMYHNFHFSWLQNFLFLYHFLKSFQIQSIDCWSSVCQKFDYNILKFSLKYKYWN